MSYHIYTTEGIVLKRTSFNEANTLLHILTEDFGFILASARATRLSSSKLRGALQEYSYVSVSCIKGKNGWKVTNAAHIKNFFFDYPEYTHKLLAQISQVLIKMIPGEFPNKEVFYLIRDGFQFLGEVKPLEIPNFEILIVLRVLYQLGYVAKDSESEIFLSDLNLWDFNILSKIESQKVKLVNKINGALKVSQL